MVSHSHSAQSRFLLSLLSAPALRHKPRWHLDDVGFAPTLDAKVVATRGMWTENSVLDMKSVQTTGGGLGRSMGDLEQ